MIPVSLQPEPANFDKDVRTPGLTWLFNNGIDPQDAPPDPSKLPTYWQKTNEQLWNSYSGVCAYLAIYFEWSTGASSTDHFIPKSAVSGQAYEWSNFRLSCLGANRAKNKYLDVLDPFKIKANTFVLNLVNGEISPNPKLSKETKKKAIATIKRLKLDSDNNRKFRLKAYSRYLRKKDEESLKELAPFVWYEADRQGLL